MVDGWSGMLRTPPAPRWRTMSMNERRTEWFGRALLAVALVASLVLVVRLVRGDSELAQRAKVVAARAKEKHALKIAERIAAECKKSPCACTLSAARGGLDLDLGKEV